MTALRVERLSALELLIYALALFLLYVAACVPGDYDDPPAPESGGIRSIPGVTTDPAHARHRSRGAATN